MGSAQAIEGDVSLPRNLISRLRKVMRDSDGTVHAGNTELCVQALLHDAIDCRASDIHFVPTHATVQMKFRIDGALLDAIRLPSSQAVRLMRHLKIMADLDPSGSASPLVARATLNAESAVLDARLTTAPTAFGEMLVLRLLDPRRMEVSINALGLGSREFELIYKWLNATAGMFLVTGPTGCGKTTTLYALLHELKSRHKSVTTIEDPVEYKVEGISQLQVDQKHGLTFAEGVRTMLRLDPDYLLVGEIRDQEAAHAAIEASASGRPLLSTLHTRDTVGAITALRNYGISDHEIATALQVVVAQRLVRKLCLACRRLEPLNDGEARWLSALGLPLPAKTWHAAGCDDCKGIGFCERVGLFEAWHLDDSDYSDILNHIDERSLREKLTHGTHRPLLNDGMTLVSVGGTTLDELRMLGTFYVPPSNSPAANQLRECLANFPTQ